MFTVLIANFIPCKSHHTLFWLLGSVLSHHTGIWKVFVLIASIGHTQHPWSTGTEQVLFVFMANFRSFVLYQCGTGALCYWLTILSHWHQFYLIHAMPTKKPWQKTTPVSDHPSFETIFIRNPALHIAVLMNPSDQGLPLCKDYFFLDYLLCS